MGIKLSNRAAYTFIVFGILVLSAIIINAVAPNPGHDSSQLDLGPLKIDETNGRVGIDTNTPGALLDLVGTGGASWTSSNWNRVLQLPNAGAIKWTANGGNWRHGIGQTSTGLFFIRAQCDDNTCPRFYDIFIGDDGNVGIGTTSPSERLDVFGNIHTTGAVSIENSLAASSVDAPTGKFQIASIDILTADQGLTLNLSSFTMRATNGDNCVVEMISSRTSGPSAPGSFDITCYSPTNVCGNFIIEPSIGEECEPPGGSIVYNYSQTGPTWSCTTGLAATEFYRTRLSCSATCDYSGAGICECTSTCFNSNSKEFYNIYYTCSDYSTTNEACEANQGGGL